MSGCFDLLGGRRDREPQHNTCGQECSRDSDCARGTICFEWTCHEGCLRDSDCGTGRACAGYICHEEVQSRPPIASPPPAPGHAPEDGDGIAPDAGLVYRRDGGAALRDGGV